MSDYNSSLPVRTQTDGDVVVKIADATIPSQQLAIDSSGKIIVKLDDAAGNGITSQTNGAQRALDVGIDVAGVQIDPRQIRALTATDVVTASNFPATVDTNYGAVSASTLRSAAQIGNATGAADFNAGTTGAQTLRVVANQGAANATPWNENIAQIAGSAPSASNSLPVQITTGSSFVSSSNPLPVILDPAGVGTPVDSFTDAVAVGVGSTANNQYTVTAAKTLHLTQIQCSGSGKFKAVIGIETGVATNVFTSYHVVFNSTATPNAIIPITSGRTVAAGVRVQVAMTNNDLGAQDLYSTISGFEV